MFQFETSLVDFDLLVVKNSSWVAMVFCPLLAIAWFIVFSLVSRRSPTFTASWVMLRQDFWCWYAITDHKNVVYSDR